MSRSQRLVIFFVACVLAYFVTWFGDSSRDVLLSLDDVGRSAAAVFIWFVMIAFSFVANIVGGIAAGGALWSLACGDNNNDADFTACYAGALLMSFVYGEWVGPFTSYGVNPLTWFHGPGTLLLVWALAILALVFQKIVLLR